MRLLYLMILTAVLGCRPAEPAAPPAASLFAAPGEPPAVYEAYAQLRPLFEQTSDTTYVINFWATWCKPCLEELPLLQEVADTRAADEALQVVLVSLDAEPRAIARIPDYLAARDIDLPVVVLTDPSKQWMRELDDKWDGALPTTFVYRGPLRYIYRRPFRTVPDVRSAVAPLIGQ